MKYTLREHNPSRTLFVDFPEMQCRSSIEVYMLLVLHVRTRI